MQEIRESRRASGHEGRFAAGTTPNILLREQNSNLFPIQCPPETLNTLQVSVAVALVCLIVLVATSVLYLIDARVGLALIAFELVGAGVGAFTAKKSVDDNWERIKEKQQAKEPRAEQRKKKEASDAGND